MIPLRDDNPTRTTPYVMWALLAINIVVFFLEEFGGGLSESRQGLVGWMAGWTMVPRELTQGVDVPTNGPTLQPVYLTLLTSMFMHGGWLHLGGNMLYLWIFGNNIEDALGHVKFLVFYLVCGVLASLSQILFKTDSIIPTLGASGAIAGVLGGYLLLYPHAKVDSLVTLGFIMTTARVPAFILLGVWIVSQFFSQFMGSMAGRGESGGVAYFAHIGGFIAGLVLIKLFGAKPTPPPPAYEGGYGAGPQGLFRGR